MLIDGPKNPIPNLQMLALAKIRPHHPSLSSLRQWQQRWEKLPPITLNGLRNALRSGPHSCREKMSSRLNHIISVFLDKERLFDEAMSSPEANTVEGQAASEEIRDTAEDCITAACEVLHLLSDRLAFEVSLGIQNLNEVKPALQEIYSKVWISTYLLRNKLTKRQGILSFRADEAQLAQNPNIETAIAEGNELLERLDNALKTAADCLIEHNQYIEEKNPDSAIRITFSPDVQTLKGDSPVAQGEERIQICGIGASEMEALDGDDNPLYFPYCDLDRVEFGNVEMESNVVWTRANLTNIVADYCSDFSIYHLVEEGGSLGEGCYFDSECIIELHSLDRTGQVTLDEARQENQNEASPLEATLSALKEKHAELLHSFTTHTAAHNKLSIEMRGNSMPAVTLFSEPQSDDHAKADILRQRYIAALVIAESVLQQEDGEQNDMRRLYSLYEVKKRHTDYIHGLKKELTAWEAACTTLEALLVKNVDITWDLSYNFHKQADALRDKKRHQETEASSPKRQRLEDNSATSPQRRPTCFVPAFNAQNNSSGTFPFQQEEKASENPSPSCSL